MRSITSRLVIGTSIFIAVFITLLAFSISYSVHKRAESARFDALKGVVYGIIGATTIDSNAQLYVNAAVLPDERLNSFNANLYAELVGNDRSTLWQSNSTLAPLPSTQIRPINDWMFEKITASDGTDLLRVQYVLAWELDNGEEIPFIVNVAENVEDLSTQLKRFDRVLWLSLLAVAPILPIVQFVMLRLSLKPLRDISDEIEAIEQGQREVLSDVAPTELAPLTQGLNALLRGERERHAQYKNLLEDLSHNLKTPISVLQNIGETNTQDGRSILLQTQSMQSALTRYAQRAVLRSPRYLLPSIAVHTVVARVVQTLNKLYTDPPVAFDVNIDDQYHVRIDEADLLEVLGNLLDNACKYGASTVHISQSINEKKLIIEDNGPGWPPGDLSQYTQRGVRADTQTTGQGIGLAATEQILRSYGGRLELSRGQNGGAKVTLYFS